MVRGAAISVLPPGERTRSALTRQGTQNNKAHMEVEIEAVQGVRSLECGRGERHRGLNAAGMHMIVDPSAAY